MSGVCIYLPGNNRLKNLGQVASPISTFLGYAFRTLELFLNPRVSFMCFIFVAIILLHFIESHFTNDRNLVSSFESPKNAVAEGSGNRGRVGIRVWGMISSYLLQVEGGCTSRSG